MVMRIAKQFDFDAAHWLPMVPDGHKCKRMHGHTYRVEVVIRDRVLPDGFIMDYAVIANAWEPLHAILDHQCLNEIGGLENPTTESLVVFIVDRIKPALRNLWAVRVYESSTTWCEWTS